MVTVRARQASSHPGGVAGKRPTQSSSATVGGNRSRRRAGSLLPVDVRGVRELLWQRRPCTIRLLPCASVGVSQILSELSFCSTYCSPSGAC